MLATANPVEATMEEYIQDAVPYLDLTVPHDDLFNGAAAVMKALFPEWSADDISYVQFKDGITNKRKPTDKKALFFSVFFSYSGSFYVRQSSQAKKRLILIRHMLCCLLGFSFWQFENTS